MNKVIFCMAVGAALVVQANVYDASTGFVTLLKSDEKDPKQTSLSTAGNWSDECVPHSNPPTNYYVAAGLMLLGPSDNVIFPSPLYMAGTVRCCGGWSKSGTFSDLCILSGGSVAYNETGSLKGQITFLSEDAQKPSCILYARSDNSYGVRLAAKVQGAAGSQVKFHSTSAYKSWIAPESGSDWTGFKGTLRFKDGFGVRATSVGLTTPGAFEFGSNALIVVNSGKDCSFGNLSFAGCSVVTNYAKIEVLGVFDTGADMKWQSMSSGVSRVSTIGDFVIGDGSQFSFKRAIGGYPSEYFDVKRRLSIGVGVQMSFAIDATSAEDPIEYTVFKLSPEAVAAGLPDFSAISVTMNNFSGGKPSAFIAVKDDPEISGGKIAYLTHKPIVVYCGSDQLSEANCTMDTDVEQSGVWSNSEFPKNGLEYYLPDGKSIAFRPPNDAHPNRIVSFPGDRLMMGDLSTIYLFVSATIPDLHLFKRSCIYPRNSCSLSGELSIHRYSGNNKASVRMLGNINFRLNSKISGDGDLVAESYYPNTSVGATLYLGGDNAEWTGGISTEWTKQTASDPEPSVTAHTKIVVGDGRNLGGSLLSFRHDSIKLHNFAELRVTNTTTFAEPTRGVLIQGNGCLNVDDGMTATLVAPLTLSGVLDKIGGGVLSLACPIRFELDNSLDGTTSPTDGLNVLSVKGGSIKVMDASALDGARLEFAAGTSLRLDLNHADVGMQSRGFSFKDEKSSISSDGRFAVVYEEGSESDYRKGIVVPLCTVRTGFAESMMAILCPRIVLERGTRSGTLFSNDNGDGTETIFARFIAKGLAISLR